MGQYYLSRFLGESSPAISLTHSSFLAEQQHEPTDGIVILSASIPFVVRPPNASV
jgi:hypothetical protein